MDFKQFQATRQWHDNLSDITTGDEEAGYAYGNTGPNEYLGIIEFSANHFYVTIGNGCLMTADLEDAERYLWDNWSRDLIN